MDLTGIELCNSERYAMGYHTYYRHFDEHYSCLDYVIYNARDMECRRLVNDNMSILGVESDHYPIITEWSFNPLIEREKLI